MEEQGQSAENDQEHLRHDDRCLEGVDGVGTAPEERTGQGDDSGKGEDIDKKDRAEPERRPEKEGGQKERKGVFREPARDGLTENAEAQDAEERDEKARLDRKGRLSLAVAAEQRDHRGRQDHDARQIGNDPADERVDLPDFGRDPQQPERRPEKRRRQSGRKQEKRHCGETAEQAAFASFPQRDPDAERGCPRSDRCGQGAEDGQRLGKHQIARKVDEQQDGPGANAEQVQDADARPRREPQRRVSASQSGEAIREERRQHE